jgi:hypothetical protein
VRGHQAERRVGRFAHGRIGVREDVGEPADAKPPRAFAGSGRNEERADGNES